MLLLLALGPALGQDQVAPQPQPANNIAPIKSPLMFKGLYGPRSGNGRKTTEVAVLAAVRMFKTTQNADGSWGAGDGLRRAASRLRSRLQRMRAVGLLAAGRRGREVWYRVASPHARTILACLREKGRTR
jgi:hypothetical protein